jgi:ribulose-5-phosphate 4-epimerase/fuculose-1-phosphate aldolase
VPAFYRVVQAQRATISNAERQMRVDLAACYRLVALYNMDDMSSTHISACVPGSEKHFLLNPYSVLFEQVHGALALRVTAGSVAAPAAR